MKCFLFACLILATATVAEAGGQRVLLLRDNHCDDGVLQVQRVRQRQVFVQRQRFRSRQFVGNRQFIGGGGSTFIRERRGPFGIFGSTTIIQN